MARPGLNIPVVGEWTNLSVVSLPERAEEHLRVIRTSMERASTFTAVPGWGGVWMGVVAVGAAVIASGTVDPRRWVLTWIMAAGVAIPIGTVTLVLGAQRTGADFTGGNARLFAVSLATPILAGAIVTTALIQVEAYGALPAVWLTLYGAAVAVGGMFAIRPVSLLGVAFMILGAAAAFSPLAVGNVLMAAGFGLLQIFVGLLIVRGHGERSR